MTPFSSLTSGAAFVQLFPVERGVTAVFDAVPYGMKGGERYERVPLIFWALLQDYDSAIRHVEGVIIDRTGSLKLARNCEHFLGYGYPQDDNRFVQKVNWTKIRDEHEKATYGESIEAAQ